MKTLLEHTLIEQLTRGFDRSPEQWNSCQSADAELIRCTGHEERYLALTTDSISEELSSGLYADMELAGWVSVMANISDLAAVGAQPIGLLISEILPECYSPEEIDRLQRGIREALAASGTYLLGGDTNSGPNLILTGCAAGWVEGRPVSRLGTKTGDRLYVSGPLGTGNAFAFARLTGAATAHSFRPMPRIHEGMCMRRFASACIDTSDGLIAALDQLMRLNQVGFTLDEYWKDSLDRSSLALAHAGHFSPWLLFAGQHGEFELAFTIPVDAEDAFLEAAHSMNWLPSAIGTAVTAQELVLPLDGHSATVDTAYIRNLSMTTGRNVSLYIDSLLRYDTQLQKGVFHHADQPNV